jgi:hypothetical protein
MHPGSAIDDKGNIQLARHRREQRIVECLGRFLCSRPARGGVDREDEARAATAAAFDGTHRTATRDEATGSSPSTQEPAGITPLAASFCRTSSRFPPATTACTSLAPPIG